LVTTFETFTEIESIYSFEITEIYYFAWNQSKKGENQICEQTN
jgi:hypothetical protein